MNLEDWVLKMEVAPKVGRGAVLAELCQRTGWSRDTAYRRLRAAGWESGRKVRSDAGSSSMSTELLHKAGALLQQSQRKDGRNPMTVRRARGLLLDNGYDVEISDSQLARLLRDYGLDKRSLKTAESHQHLRSLKPNHCHLVDPSLALWYFTPQKKLRIISAEEHYKNKDYYQGRKIENKCWRYVLVDHYSGSLCIRYYESAGENMLNLWDFLLYAWGKKSDALYAFCGLPDLMVWDKGSANSSKPIQRALESLGIENWAHKAGAPRAKGSVETMNRHWEGWLEVALRYEPVGSIEELNALADKYCAGFNANSFTNHDSALHRNGKLVGVRLELWQTIQDLRLLPEDSICRALLTEEPEKRKLDGSLMLNFRGYAIKGTRKYSLQGLPGVEVGMQVTVQALIYSGTDKIRATWYMPKHLGGELLSYELEPIAVDSAGFLETASVLGEEFQALPKTEGQKQRELVANPETLEGFKTHSVVQTKPVAIPEIARGKEVYLPREGLRVIDSKPSDTPELPMRPEVISGADVRLSVTQAVARLRSEFGELPTDLDLRERYPNGLTAAELHLEIENLQNKRNKKEAV